MSTRFRFRLTTTIEKDRVTVSPDPAVVDQGMVIEWYFLVEPGLPTLDLEVYFSKGSPTGWPRRRTKADRSQHGSTSSVIEAVAEEPGEYKYGVRAIEHATEEVIADDDPYLIVRRRH
jgi:hypothetical protein